jgi:hypothetical protein
MKKLNLLAIAFIVGTTSLFASNFSQGRPVVIKPPVEHLSEDFTKVESNSNNEEILPIEEPEFQTTDIIRKLRKKTKDERYKIKDLREFAFINPSIIYKE